MERFIGYLKGSFWVPFVASYACSCPGPGTLTSVDIPGSDHHVLQLLVATSRLHMCLKPPFADRSITFFSYPAVLLVRGSDYLQRLISVSVRPRSVGPHGKIRGYGQPVMKR